MSGGHLDKFKKLFALNFGLIIVLNSITIMAISYFLFEFTNLHEQMVLLIGGGCLIILATLSSLIMTRVLTKPTEYLAQSIFHISPNEHLVAAPDVDKLGFGRELVTSLTRQMYDLASNHRSITNIENAKANLYNGLDILPICVLGLDDKGNVMLHNAKFREFFGTNSDINKPLEEIINIRFLDENLTSWKNSIKNKSINATNTWSGVEVKSVSGENESYFDIVASYSQKNASGLEIILVFFPRTERYEAEETAVDLLSMSVHEIRTPLTIMRGYIEALKQELSTKVDPETAKFLERISTSSENLATYMANVLNVAKAEQNQLKLDLRPTDWGVEIDEIISALRPRANVRGKNLILNTSSGLPKVACDTLSINEVVSNLIENSIKYSPADKKNIYIDVGLDTDGSVLTTVRDEGVGIPDSVIKNLFTKFYRDHRNKNHVAGTGLGLYISKEIVSAHHGNIWLKSKEGEGTSVSFTLIPAAKLDEIAKNADNKFEKVGRGWIKNHNMQRR